MVRDLDVFERNRVPFELRFWISILYSSSFRRAARALSEIHKVSKKAVGSGLGSLVVGLMLTHLEYLEEL